MQSVLNVASFGCLILLFGSSVIGATLCGMNCVDPLKLFLQARERNTCVCAEQITNYHWIITCSMLG